MLEVKCSPTEVFSVFFILHALITHSTCAPHMEERCGCFDGRGLRACFLTFSAPFQVLTMAVVRADGGARRGGERGAS
jgi:hypothetical protein